MEWHPWYAVCSVPWLSSGLSNNLKFGTEVFIIYSFDGTLNKMFFFSLQCVLQDDPESMLTGLQILSECETRFCLGWNERLSWWKKVIKTMSNLKWAKNVYRLNWVITASWGISDKFSYTQDIFVIFVQWKTFELKEQNHEVINFWSPFCPLFCCM